MSGEASRRHCENPSCSLRDITVTVAADVCIGCRRPMPTDADRLLGARGIFAGLGDLSDPFGGPK